MTFRSGSIYRHHPAEQLGESAIVQLIALKLPRLGFDKIMASDWLETASITVDLTNTGKTSLSADTCRNFDSSVQRLLGYLNNGDCDLSWSCQQSWSPLAKRQREECVNKYQEMHRRMREPTGHGRVHRCRELASRASGGLLREGRPRRHRDTGRIKDGIGGRVLWQE